MANPSKAANSGRASEPEYQEFVVKRDSERPFSFAGVRLAKASGQGSPSLVATGSIDTLEAAVFRTRGGKYVTTLSRTIKDPIQEFIQGFTAEENTRPKGEFQKAAVHESLDEAMAWFRPGFLTDAIRSQLGLDEPIRID